VWSGGSVTSNDGGATGWMNSPADQPASRPGSRFESGAIPLRKSLLLNTSLTVAWLAVR
jgi:hypothetical protein